MLQKGESFGEQGGEKQDETRSVFLIRIRRARGTCNRKSQTLI
jgi:hypothetical protein